MSIYFDWFEAMSLMKSGHKIARAGWPDGYWVSFNAAMGRIECQGGTVFYFRNTEKMNDSNWMTYVEPIVPPEIGDACVNAVGHRLYVVGKSESDLFVIEDTKDHRFCCLLSLDGLRKV